MMELDIQRIKNELKERGVNDSWLAKQMCLSRQCISQKLKSKDIRHAQRIADALGIPALDLILEDGEKTNPGVYLLLDDTARVVYVGQSLRPQERIQQHARSNKQYVSCRIIHCDEKDLDKIETDEIFKHCPKYNKVLPKSVKYPYIGSVEPMQNKKFIAQCSIINNRVFINLTDVDIVFF